MAATKIQRATANLEALHNGPLGGTTLAEIGAKLWAKHAANFFGDDNIPNATASRKAGLYLELQRRWFVSLMENDGAIAAADDAKAAKRAANRAEAIAWVGNHETP